MMTRNPLRLLPILLLFLLGCGDAPPPQEQAVVGFLLDRSYDEPSVAQRAIRLAVAQAGLTDQVRVVTVSTDNTPEGAAAAALQLISRENAIALIGPNVSALAIAAGDVAERFQVPLISPASTHPRTTAAKRFVFRATFVDREQGTLLARFLHDSLQITRVAILFDKANPSSRSVTAAFSESFTGEIVSSIGYSPGADPLRLLQDVATADIEALLLPNSDDDVIVQARHVRELGFPGLLLGSDAWSPAQVSAEPALEGSLLPLHWHLDEAVQREEGRRFVELWQEKTGAPPGALAALTYDAAGLVAHAMRSAHGVESQDLRDALTRMQEFRGATGVISYRENSGDPRKNVAVGQFRSGRLELASSTP